jgi:hypothetical protein
LSSAIQNATYTNKEVIIENLKVNEESKKQEYLKLIVTPLKDFKGVKKLLIVSFEDSAALKDVKQDQIKLDPLSKSSEHIIALENELKVTKERLNVY